MLISRKRSAPCATLYIGLDHFSHINKGLGHNAGDKLLQGVAHRIKNCISDLDLAARLGGDEFTVALTHMFDASEATNVAQKILKSLDEPFLIDGNEIFSSASIGIATYPECGDTASELLTNSSVAMQIAKANGRHGIQFFTDSLNQNYLLKIEREGDFRDALAKDRLKINFRPFVGAREKLALGYYMNLLWDHPELGLIDASETVSAMENNQVQTKLTYKLLHDGAKLYHEKTIAEGTQGLYSLVIPFPAYHLFNANFISNLRNALDTSKIPPARLILEINETRADFNLGEFQDLARQIANMGVKLALNLFSSPKTPLTHLFQLELDAIRINLDSMDSITDNPRSAIFMKSITSMAHDLGIEIIVDGITCEKEASLVADLGVDALMGSYFVDAPFK